MDSCYERTKGSVYNIKFILEESREFLDSIVEFLGLLQSVSDIQYVNISPWSIIGKQNFHDHLFFPYNNELQNEL